MSIEKIIITGAAGFIGSHLTELCVELGFNVRAFVHYNSTNRWGWLENSKYLNEVEIISGDIRDYDSVYDAMKQCHVVFHLAALIGIPYSYISPLGYIRTNVEGTYNVLQAAKELNTENIIITSTSETYGTAQYIPIDERHPVVAQSPYAATKISCEQLALSYYRAFGTPVKVVRPFNTYGPRQSARAIIPTVITQILSGKDEIKIGNSMPTRDLTFVRDTVNGFVEIGNNERFFGEITNIGMNTEISIEDLVSRITDLMNARVQIKTDELRVRPSNSEVERLCCDNGKLLKYSSWSPRYDLKSGLEETIEWFRNNAHIYKPDLYNI